MNVSIDRELERMVDFATRLVSAWDGREGFFCCDWLDDESFVINYDIHDRKPVEYAENALLFLGKYAETLLNARDFSRRREGRWVCHSEPNYWGKDGEECDVDSDVFNCIQVCVYWELGA